MKRPKKIFPETSGPVDPESVYGPEDYYSTQYLERTTGLVGLDPMEILILIEELSDGLASK